MRSVCHSDLVHLGRMLLAQPPHRRPVICARAFYEAHAADKYRRVYGRAHPGFGDGSLASWASQHACPPEPRPPEPSLSDPDYAACLMLVLREVLTRADPALA